VRAEAATDALRPLHQAATSGDIHQSTERRRRLGHLLAGGAANARRESGGGVGGRAQSARHRAARGGAGRQEKDRRRRPQGRRESRRRTGEREENRERGPEGGGERPEQRVRNDAEFRRRGGRRLPLAAEDSGMFVVADLEQGEEQGRDGGTLARRLQEGVFQEEHSSGDQGEFVGLCALIETRGIIRIIKKKDPRMHKVSLVWDQEEVVAALRDKQLMSTIIEDGSCLGKM
jgi:hypothetical protein